MLSYYICAVLRHKEHFSKPKTSMRMKKRHFFELHTPG
jgi:hypothetical protein